MHLWGGGEKRIQGADRRILEIDYRRRKLNRRKREYIYHREIYLSDTNAYQNVYFANFVYYFGEAREDFLDWMLGENKASFMQSGVGLVTVDCSVKYARSLYVFDLISIKLTVPKMTRTKLYFKFEITNRRTGELNATGLMTCGATRNNKASTLPDEIVNPIRKHFLI